MIDPNIKKLFNKHEPGTRRAQRTTAGGAVAGLAVSTGGGLLKSVIPAKLFLGHDLLMSLANEYGYRDRVMMKLGEFKFSIDTAAYNTIEWNQSWRWAAQERIGRKPAHQFTGPDAATLSLSGITLPKYRGGDNPLDKLADEAASGKPLLLTDGTGKTNSGLWCVNTITQTQTEFASNGEPRLLEFTLELVQYGKDEFTPGIAPPKGTGQQGTGQQGTGPKGTDPKTTEQQAKPQGAAS